jgi:hypothetical protein
MFIYSSVWDWVGSLKRTAQKVLKLVLEGGAACRTGSEKLFQAIAVSGPHGQGSRTWNTSTEENDEAVVHSCFLNFYQADSGFKMEHWSFFLFLPPAFFFF